MKNNLITKSLLTFLVFTLFSANLFAAQYTVEGYVNYHNDVTKPLQGVNVQLCKMNGQIIQTVQTDATGKYTFFQVHTGNYRLTATYNANAGGINFEDSYLVLLHLLNISPLNGIALLAADVNGDGTVTWADYTAITFGYFLAGTPFAAGAWEFPNITFVAGGKTGTNLGGTSTGDVNGSFQPNLTKQGLVTLNETKGSLEVRSQESIEIPVYAAENAMINGMGLVFDYNADAFEVESIASDLGEIKYAIMNNQIRMVWNDVSAQGRSIDIENPVIMIKGRTSHNFSASNNINISVGAESHVINENGTSIANFKFATPVIKWKENNNFSHLAYPNPAKNYINIEINSFVDTQSSIEILNLNGARVIILDNQQIRQGINTIPINLENLGNGRYFYKIMNNNYNATGNIIVNK